MTDNFSTSTIEQERRSSLRLDMENELVAIFIKNSQGEEKIKYVSCLDISNGGISINNDEPLEVGSFIKIQTNPRDESCPAYSVKVLRCNVQDSGWYNIGLIFQSDELSKLETE